ncbi:putative SET domain containing protein [Leishmania utingensis]|uniref:SET domain containing protein n=1 Tax=Leishmania utingensis TaxID=653362 RepID=A0AAW3AFT0_9TRYP
MSANAIRAAWNGAVELKRHCSHVINTLGPQTPPEAFLYRGNAYYALGQPYFALADYNTAGSVLRLSGEHQRRCRKALESFPETQTGVYPSTDSHLHIFVKPTLAKSCAIETINEHVGRGVRATENMPRHSVVVQPTSPWLLYPTEEGLCSHCGASLPERSFACANDSCHEEYCSRDCRQEAMAHYHAAVCCNKDYQSIELDVFAQMTEAEKAGAVAERNAAAAQLLMLRVLSTSIQKHVVPSAMGQVRILSGRLTFSPQVLSRSMLHLYERLAHALRISTIVSYEEVVGILARITANCFHRDGSVELNLPRSMLNHSCAANVAEDGQTGAMITTRDVARGEELVINYYPHLKDLAYEERITELERRGFPCMCAKCQRRE